MNYLTNYYKNLSEQLEAKVNRLQSQVRMINEAVNNYATTQRDRENNMGAATPPSYSGAVLGQMLGQGNMNAVNQYLGQYGMNLPTVAGQAVQANQGVNRARGRVERAGDSDRQRFSNSGDLNGDGIVNGADLGLAMGQGQNSSGIINNWTAPYSSAGMAAYTTPTPTVFGNRPRGAQSSGEDTGNYPQPEGPAGPGANYPTVGGQSEGPVGPASGMGGQNQEGGLPPIRDFNNDGRIDGADLGIYISMYGAVPPGFGLPQQNQNGGQPTWSSYGIYGMGDSNFTGSGRQPSSQRRRISR